MERGEGKEKGQKREEKQRRVGNHSVLFISHIETHTHKQLLRVESGLGTTADLLLVAVGSRCMSSESLRHLEAEGCCSPCVVCGMCVWGRGVGEVWGRVRGMWKWVQAREGHSSQFKVPVSAVLHQKRKDMVVFLASMGGVQFRQLTKYGSPGV